MKLTLTINQAGDKDLIEALRIIRDLPLTGDQAFLLDRATNKIVDEHIRYNNLRDSWLRKHGDKSGDDRWIIPGGDPRIKELRQYEAEIAKERFMVRIVKKIKLPDHFAISANQLAALMDIGIIEDFDVPVEEEMARDIKVLEEPKTEIDEAAK